MTSPEQEIVSDGGQAVTVQDSAFTEQSRKGHSEDLADEFAAIANATVGEKSVNAEIWDVGATEDGEIEITARLPDGSKPTRTFQKPIPWSDEYALARLVDEHGYTPSSYGSLEGDRIELKATSPDGTTPKSDDWKFVIPEKGLAWSEIVKESATGEWAQSAFQYSAIVGWPLFGLYMAYKIHPVLIMVWLLIGMLSIIGSLEVWGDDDD